VDHRADGEAELESVFERALAARKLGAAAQDVADRWFLENLERIHRAGEGAAFTGLQPTGVPIDKKVAAADRSIEVGNLKPLAGLITDERWPELERRFATVLERKDCPVDDVDAGRHYIEAYVHFFKFAERLRRGARATTTTTATPTATHTSTRTDEVAGHGHRRHGGAGRTAGAGCRPRRPAVVGLPDHRGIGVDAPHPGAGSAAADPAPGHVSTTPPRRHRGGRLRRARPGDREAGGRAAR
jgi:hypothetical protein